jgi:peptidoglycan/xylan/chitin deacetylase (PgdA/CDA1 family)
MLHFTRLMTRGVQLLLILVGLLLAASISVEHVQAHENEIKPQPQPQNLYKSLLEGQRILKNREYIKPKQPTVYLTFDDGPSHLTSQVLDILQAEGVKATFFALGSLAESQPKIIQRIVREGHALGNHTLTHEYKQLYSSFDSFWEQVKQSEDIFEKIAGVRPKLLRAPGGTHRNFDAFYFYYLDQAEYLVYDWNVDSGDSRRRNVPAQEIVATVKASQLAHELNVLLHDGTGHEETVKALPEIIRYYKELGYTFAPLSQQVKPLQFSLGQPKWERTHSVSVHERLVASIAKRSATQERLAKLDQKLEELNQKSEELNQKLEELDQEQEDHLAYQGQVSVVESQEAREQLIHPALTLRFGSEKLQLTADRYELRDGRFHVPLRQFVETMGGQVAWNQEDKVATVRYGFRVIEYHINERMMKTFNPGEQVRTAYLAEMSIRDGTIMIPLRTTAVLLKNRVADYTVTSSKREVYVQMHKNSYLAYMQIGRLST